MTFNFQDCVLEAENLFGIFRAIQRISFNVHLLGHAPSAVLMLEKVVL